VFHRGKRVAAHARRYGGPRHGTLPEHMPSARRRYAEWTPERMQRQARGIGPNTEALILAVLSRRPHPKQGFRTCLGVLRLFRSIAIIRQFGGAPMRISGDSGARLSARIGRKARSRGMLAPWHVGAMKAAEQRVPRQSNPPFLRNLRWSVGNGGLRFVCVGVAPYTGCARHPVIERQE
jgi:hypothetical protein